MWNSGRDQHILTPNSSHIVLGQDPLAAPFVAQGTPLA